MLLSFAILITTGILSRLKGSDEARKPASFEQSQKGWLL